MAASPTASSFMICNALCANLYSTFPATSSDIAAAAMIAKPHMTETIGTPLSPSRFNRFTAAHAALSASAPSGERVVNTSDVGRNARRNQQIGQGTWVVGRKGHLNPHELRRRQLAAPRVMPPCGAIDARDPEIRKSRAFRASEQRFRNLQRGDLRPRQFGF